MAVTINLVTFSGQTVTPKDDAIIYDSAIGQCGIFYGCSLSASGNTISVDGGYGMIRGRFFEISASSETVTLSSSGTLKGRIYIKLDLSNSTTPIQVIVERASSLHTLTQEEDANYSDGIWEMELATFKITTSEIVNFTETYDTITDNATLISALRTTVTAMQTSLAIKTRTVTLRTDAYGQVNVPSDIQDDYTLINVHTNDYRYLAVINANSLVRIIDANGTHPNIANKSVSLTFVYV